MIIVDPQINDISASLSGQWLIGDQSTDEVWFIGPVLFIRRTTHAHTHTPASVSASLYIGEDTTQQVTQYTKQQTLRLAGV